MIFELNWMWLNKNLLDIFTELFPRVSLVSSNTVFETLEHFENGATVRIDSFSIGTKYSFARLIVIFKITPVKTP